MVSGRYSVLSVKTKEEEGKTEKAGRITKGVRMTEKKEWLAQCRRQLKRSLRERIDYGFIYTYKPVLDDAPVRIFDTIAEYRKWCERALPAYLGYRRAKR